MIRENFVSLPVRELDKAMAFYTAIGATANPQFSGDGSACMVFSESFFVMLMTHAKWATFTKKPIVAGSMALGLFCDSRAEVDAIMKAAQGDKTDIAPLEDHGYMYQRSIEDPDGHHWEITWFDQSQMPKTA